MSSLRLIFMSSSQRTRPSLPLCLSTSPSKNWAPGHKKAAAPPSSSSRDDKLAVCTEGMHGSSVLRALIQCWRGTRISRPLLKRPPRNEATLFAVILAASAGHHRGGPFLATASSTRMTRSLTRRTTPPPPSASPAPAQDFSKTCQGVPLQVGAFRLISR